MTSAVETHKARRIAGNPVPYWGRQGSGGKTREVFEEAFRDYQRIGYTAVKADVLEGQTAAEYLSWIDGFGLSPSVGLFGTALDETVDMADVVESARRFGALQAELGLDRTMLSSVPVPERMARPGVGAAFDQGRLDRAIDSAGRVCEVLVAEGIRVYHHSHLGGVFETEHDITSLLDTLGPDLIGFGPDTGHLLGAGIDPIAMMHRYADRIGAIHLKDAYPDFLDPADRVGMSYQDLVRSGRFCAEPGLGVMDLDGILAAVPDDYDGDFMIEVDHPSVATLYESSRISFEWATAAIGATR